MRSALIAGVAFLTGTPAGRSTSAGWVEDFTNGKIPGTMKIGTLESIGWARPVATNVEFFTPDGARVIYVDRGEVDLSIKDLLAGRVGFDEARADGGEFVIEINPNGGTNVQDAFSKPDGDAKLELHNMHFEGMRVLLRLDGETPFVIRDLEGFLSVWRRDTPGARITLARVEGTFEKPQLLKNTIELTRMDGEVWAKEDHVVEMEFNVKIGSGGIKAHFDYYKRPENPAQLRLEPEVGSGAILATMGIEVRSWFSDKLDVQFEDVETD